MPLPRCDSSRRPRANRRRWNTPRRLPGTTRRRPSSCSGRSRSRRPPPPAFFISSRCCRSTRALRSACTATVIQLGGQCRRCLQREDFRRVRQPGSVHSDGRLPPVRAWPLPADPCASGENFHRGHMMNYQAQAIAAYDQWLEQNASALVAGDLEFERRRSTSAGAPGRRRRCWDIQPRA